MQVTFGRVYKEDVRDGEFILPDNISEGMPKIDKKNWWPDGWYGDQKSTPHCVVYSWSHWFEDGPVIPNINLSRPKPPFNMTDFYNECRLRDGISGTYEGTTVRAGAKVLKEVGVISEYRWAANVQQVIDAVTYLGPMVVGTRWYERMSAPTSARNIMRPSGRQIGGHAYLINGIDHTKELFRVKNSWGRHWGKDGHAFITFSDFEKLLLDLGEACIAFENVIDFVPTLDDLTPP